jgi:hypothetical protein
MPVAPGMGMSQHDYRFIALRGKDTGAAFLGHHYGHRVYGGIIINAIRRKPRSMAHQTVQFIIGRILTDDELRERFLVAPVEILSSFRDLGFDLTDAEVDALTNTNQQLWRSGADWIDPRLQRCGLKARPKN